MTADQRTVAATGPITGVDYGRCRVGDVDDLFAGPGSCSLNRRRFPSS
jgi:hypothetical protein